MTFSSLEHYMTEVKSNLELYFGLPSNEEQQKKIDELSIQYGYPFEEMSFNEFEYFYEKTQLKPEKGENSFFELCFFVAVGEKVSIPKVTLEKHKYRGYDCPKLVVHDEYLQKFYSDGRIFINDEIITKVGQDIDYYIGYEFIEFHRVTL